MAFITKKFLVEQVQQLLNGGDPSIAKKYEQRMIESFVQTTINKHLKTEYFNVVLPGDETIPEGMVLATYDNIAVTAYKDRSRALLPAMPVKLRRGMGVYHVSRIDDLDNPFIPLQAGQNSFVKSQNLMNDLLGQIAYELIEQYVVFTTNLLARAIPITEVLMRLVVLSMDKYGDWDILPIPGDWGSAIVTEVYQMLLQTPPADKKVDSIDVQTVPIK